MANTDSTYIGKNAAPLVNPTTATVFQQTVSAIATVASTQAAKAVYVKYAGYLAGGAGTSNNINIVRVALRASGRMTFGVAGNFTPTLLLGAPGTTIPAPTSAGNATLGGLTPQAATAAGTGIWAIDASLAWDPTSGLIGGNIGGYQAVLVNGTATETLTANAAITPATGFIGLAPLTTLATNATQAAAQANNGGEAVLFGLCAGLFSVSNANNVAYMDDFEWEVL